MELRHRVEQRAGHILHPISHRPRYRDEYRRARCRRITHSKCHEHILPCSRDRSHHLRTLMGGDRVRSQVGQSDRLSRRDHRRTHPDRYRHQDPRRTPHHMIDYTLIRSSRRTLSIQIDRSGTLIARAPMRMSVTQIEHFIMVKKDWIEKKIKSITTKVPKIQYTAVEIQEMKKKLRTYIVPRVHELWE